MGLTYVKLCQRQHAFSTLEPLKSHELATEPCSALCSTKTDVVPL